jgi:hypothetical protein
MKRVFGKSSPRTNVFRSWREEKTMYGCLLSEAQKKGAVL